MYNKATFLGNLTRDIELKYLQSGSAVANTAIATSHKFKTAAGEQKEEVCFMDLSMFGRTAEVANQYLRKGSRVLVEGRIKLEQWTAQDGTKRSKHILTVSELKMLGDNTHGQGGGNDTGYRGGNEMNHYNEATPNNNIDSPERHNVGGNMNRPPNGETYAQGSPQNPPPEIDINDGDIPF